MLSEDEELIEIVDRFLTTEVLGNIDTMIRNECVAEAERLLETIDDYLEKHYVNLNLPSQSMLRRKD